MFPPTKLHLGNPYLWRRWRQKNKTMPLYWHFTTRSVQSMERRDCFNDKYAWFACRTHTRDQKVIDQYWDAQHCWVRTIQLCAKVTRICCTRSYQRDRRASSAISTCPRSLSHWEQTDTVYYFYLQVQSDRSSGNYQSYISLLMAIEAQVDLRLKEIRGDRDNVSVAGYDTGTKQSIPTGNMSRGVNMVDNNHQSDTGVEKLRTCTK